MAVTLKGLAVVWGAGNLTFTGVAISGTTGKIQNYNFTREGSQEFLADADGEEVGVAFFNNGKTLELNVVPSDASAIATAKTNLDAMLPAPGTAITVADADGAGTAIEASHSGVYLCISSKVGRTNRGPATIDLVMIQRDANNIAASIS